MNKKLPTAFIYKGKVYIRAIPCKRLFNSTTVHEVINRGDFFAVEPATGYLTVIPGDAPVEVVDLKFSYQKVFF